MKKAGMLLLMLVLSMPAMAEDMTPALAEIAKASTAELHRMDRAAAGVAQGLSGRDMRGAEARSMLGGLCRSLPYAVDCALVDAGGRMIVVEPAAFAKFEGSDISRQEQIVRLRKSKQPVLSNVFRTVEGIDAVDLEHPVFSPSGEFAGSVSLLIRPESLFSQVLIPVMRGMPVEAFVMQTDGRIIYDADREEIGRMLFDDPMYRPFPQLVEVGKMAARERSGAGSYEFRQEGSGKVVRKDASWTTVGLHGTEWRLVVMHVRAGHSGTAGRDSGAAGPVSPADALRALSQSPELGEALSGNDEAKVRRILVDFFREHEGLYSVQWLDARGTNRYGYPEVNSLINFDVTAMRTASSKPMLDALSAGRESSFECPLVEGKTGVFFMVPVHEGSRYLGMIYTIRLKGE